MGILFNDKTIKGKKPKDNDYFIKEEQGTRGAGRLALKVLTNGARDFYFFYYQQGKLKKIKIGRYGKPEQGLMPLAEARQKFGEYSKQVAEGLDPKVVKKEQEQAKRKEQEKKDLQGSITQLVQFHIENLTQNKSERHSREVNRAFEKDFLPFIDPAKKANDFTSDDILKVLEPVLSRGSKSYHNKLRVYLSSLFAYGIKFDGRTESQQKKTKFFIEFNPVTMIQPVETAKAKSRYMTEQDIKLFWEQLDRSNIEPTRKAIFKIMLLMGTRVEQTAKAEWQEINFDEKTWLIPITNTKNQNGDHLLPLPNTVFRILQDLKDSQQGKLVFPSTNGKPFTVYGINQSMTRITNQAFSPKDLRTTFKTISGKAGLSKEIRDRIQNHALTDVSTQHYDFYDYLPQKREALERWESYLINTVGIKPC